MENRSVQPVKNKNNKAIRVLLIILIFLVAAAGVSFIMIYNIISGSNYESLLQNPKKPSSPQTSASSGAAKSAAVETLSYNGKKYARNEAVVSLLFLGIDSSKQREEQNMGYRSDMVLICAIDTFAKKASLISIPRDTYTTMYKVDRDTGNIESTVRDKITNAYAFGGGPKAFGADNSMACVQIFLQREGRLENPPDFKLDIPVYLFAAIDIDGIAPVASAVGGIEVTLDYSIPGVGEKGDTVLLSGKKAEDYIRDRHNTPGGDLGRASKEQLFMLKLAEKIKNMGAVNVILTLYGELNKYVTTNLSTTQMVDLAKILSKTDIDSIEKYTIPGENRMKNGVSYYFHDEEKTLDLLLRVYYKEI